MKKILFAIAALCLCAGLSAQQPQNRPDGKDFKKQMQERLQSEHIAYLTTQLELTPEEAQVFWPIYNKAQAEQKEAQKVVGEAKKALKLAVKENKSESEVSAALDAYLKAKSSRKDPFADYKKDFVKAIGVAKTAKLYVAEDSFRSQQLHRLGNGKGQQPGVKFPQGQRPHGPKPQGERPQGNK